MNSSETLIMRPFNGVFCACLAFFLLLLVIFSLALRRKDERTRALALSAVCTLTLIGFFVYKYYLSIDEEYNVITAFKGGFNWWGELPLQLCNINMILIPVAVLRKSRPMMCFAFFVAPLGAMMALAMPGVGFDGYSILLPRMLGFFMTHFMIVIEGLAVVTLGLYYPEYRDLPRTILTILLIALVIFGFNMFLRKTGLYVNANYFFSVETEGNPVLELFHSWLPYPFLYLLPCTLILGGYMAVIMIGFFIAEKLRGKKSAEAK